jgi:5-methylcytosine-specific restriction protein A
MSRYDPPTPRSKMTRTKAARIFLAWDGRCGRCGLDIRQGEPYEIDHPLALALGGSDVESKLQPLHLRCHADKDRRAIAKRDRIVTQGWAGKAKRRPMPGSKASAFKKRMNGQVERR